MRPDFLKYAKKMFCLVVVLVLRALLVVLLARNGGLVVACNGTTAPSTYVRLP